MSTIKKRIDRVIHKSAKAYKPGGISGLAKKLDKKRPAVFNYKLNPDNDEYRLTIHELLDILDATQDLKILQAINHAFNFVVVKKIDFDSSQVTDPAIAMAKWGVEHGQTYEAILHALNDKTTSENELEKIRAEIQDDIQMQYELLSCLEAIKGSLQAEAK